VARYLLIRPASLQPADLVAHSVGLVKLIGGGTFADDLEHVRQRTLAAVQRSVHPAGLMRQTLAAVADTTRHELLARIACPTLVIHGTADPLVPLACGEDTARRIPGARFHAIEGMGHDWPPALVPIWLQLLLPHLQSASPTPQTVP
jgi:pimeloyl-ACP methyl ester carboxylesterase